MLGLEHLVDFALGVSGGIRADANPNDERFWSSVMTGPLYPSGTGLRVSPAESLQVSCMFQGIRLIAETISTLPLKPFRDLGEGPDGHDLGKQVVRDHYLWRGLHTKKGRPNAWQTAQQWRETMTMQCIAWGAAYSRILSLDPLNVVPLEPNSVTPEQIKDSYRLRFRWRNDDNVEQILSQEEVFRLEGPSIHRFLPLRLVSLMREAVGLWLAMEKFGASYFAQGAKPSLFLTHPGNPDPKVLQRIQENIRQSWQGLGNMHKVLLGVQGITPKEVGFSAKESQMTEAMQAQVLEFARWLNVPEHMLRAAKAPPYASREASIQEFIDFTINPWTTRWEGSVDRDLNLDDDITAEHVLDGLLRGNTVERFQAYASAIMNGFMAENEVRVRENLNPVEGLWTPRRSVNQDRGANPSGDASSPPPPAQRQEPPPPPDNGDQNAGAAPPRRVLLIAQGAARRVVRRELAALRDKGAKLATNAPAWREFVTAFYTDHAAFVGGALELEPSLARAYSDRHRDALLAGGLAAAEPWESAAVDELVALTLEETAHAA